MKLEVGMYVRTEYGISKIVNIFFEKTSTFIETDNGLGNCNMSTRGKLHKGIYILEEDYKTFIDNNVKSAIIDLIKVGDYVNGYKIYSIYDDDKYVNEYNLKHKKCLGKNIYDEDYQEYLIYEEDIETIVTKEQFEAMQYKVV